MKLHSPDTSPGQQRPSTGESNNNNVLTFRALLIAFQNCFGVLFLVVNTLLGSENPGRRAPEFQAFFSFSRQLNYENRRRLIENDSILIFIKSARCFPSVAVVGGEEIHS
jgi:hypothetical protein